MLTGAVFGYLIGVAAPDQRDLASLSRRLVEALNGRVCTSALVVVGLVVLYGLKSILLCVLVLVGILAGFFFPGGNHGLKKRNITIARGVSCRHKTKPAGLRNLPSDLVAVPLRVGNADDVLGFSSNGWRSRYGHRTRRVGRHRGWEQGVRGHSPLSTGRCCSPGPSRGFQKRDSYACYGVVDRRTSLRSRGCWTGPVMTVRTP